MGGGPPPPCILQKCVIAESVNGLDGSYLKNGLKW